MTATLLPGHTTVFIVEADTLHCTRPGCHYVAKVTSHSVGERCQHCEKLEVPRPGTLERRSHQVDVAAFRAVGECSCEIFQFGQEHPLFAPRTMRPFLSRLTPGQLDTLPRGARDANVCKHIRCARAAYAEAQNLDALLLALPSQHQQT
jgi:hypothetical protein